MQPIKTIPTILVEDYPRTIPVEFGQITIRGSKEMSFEHFFIQLNVKL